MARMRRPRRHVHEETRDGCMPHPRGLALISDPPRDAGLVVRDRDEFAQRVRVPATAISFDGLNKARFTSHRYERASRLNHVRRSIRTPFTFVVSKCVVPRPQPGAFRPRMSNGSRNRPFSPLLIRDATFARVPPTSIGIQSDITGRSRSTGPTTAGEPSRRGRPGSPHRTRSLAMLESDTASSI